MEDILILVFFIVISLVTTYLFLIKTEMTYKVLTEINPFLAKGSKEYHLFMLKFVGCGGLLFLIVGVIGLLVLILQ